MAREKKQIHEPYMKLKGFMRENDLILDDIATLLGLQIGTVSQKINGNSDFLISEVDKIISTYGGTYDIFFA
jgi:hypothetical protein